MGWNHPTCNPPPPPHTHTQTHTHTQFTHTNFFKILICPKHEMRCWHKNNKDELYILTPYRGLPPIISKIRGWCRCFSTNNIFYQSTNATATETATAGVKTYIFQLPGILTISTVIHTGSLRWVLIHNLDAYGHCIDIYIFKNKRLNWGI